DDLPSAFIAHSKLSGATAGGSSRRVFDGGFSATGEGAAVEPAASDEKSLGSVASARASSFSQFGGFNAAVWHISVSTCSMCCTNALTSSFHFGWVLGFLL